MAAEIYFYSVEERVARLSLMRRGLKLISSLSSEVRTPVARLSLMRRGLKHSGEVPINIPGQRGRKTIPDEKGIETNGNNSMRSLRTQVARLSLMRRGLKLYFCF